MIINSLNIAQWLFWWSTILYGVSSGQLWNLEKVLHHEYPMLSTFFESLTFKVMHWHEKVILQHHRMTMFRHFKAVGHSSHLFLNSSNGFLIGSPPLRVQRGILMKFIIAIRRAILIFWVIFLLQITVS